MHIRPKPPLCPSFVYDLVNLRGFSPDRSQEANHKPSTGRSVIALVVLLLRVHRVSEAEIVAREFGNNCTPPQNLLIEDLLDAFDQNDENKVRSFSCECSLSPLTMKPFARSSPR